jgi:hypothetical protein
VIAIPVNTRPLALFPVIKRHQNIAMSNVHKFIHRSMTMCDPLTPKIWLVGLQAYCTAAAKGSIGCLVKPVQTRPSSFPHKLITFFPIKSHYLCSPRPVQIPTLHRLPHPHLFQPLLACLFHLLHFETMRITHIQQQFSPLFPR